MCYSVESSLKTTLMSFIAIVYLFSSGNPYYKWLAVTLIGWCLMQFAELILWTTDPRNGCTNLNKVITMTLIPFVLLLQPLGSLLGSFYVIPWSKSSDFRKTFSILFTILIISIVGFYHYYEPYKICTTVTPGGHLYWATQIYKEIDSIHNKIIYFIWGLLIILPLLLFWDKSILLILALFLIPLFGFSYGLLNTDSRASIWCYYTSYTSIIASISLFLKQMGIYDIVGGTVKNLITPLSKGGAN